MSLSQEVVQSCGCQAGQAEQEDVARPGPGRGVAQITRARADLRRPVLQALVGPVQPAAAQQHH